MTSIVVTILPAGEGVAFDLAKGLGLKIINTHGTQVVDFWALDAADPGEYLSMAHSRNAWYRIRPEIGATFVTNRRRPIVTLAEDTSPGIHDTLFPCCDARRYVELGAGSDHASCAGNYAAALAAIGIEAGEPPAPLNLFMNVVVEPSGKLSLVPPVSRPGDLVVLRALRDARVVMSACPHDIFPVNGPDCKPSDVAYRILDGEG